MQQHQQHASGHGSPPSVGGPRATRLLYRRGLPDLPELVEPDEDEEATADDISMNTFSTRHSTSTSASSRDFPSSGAVAAQPLKTLSFKTHVSSQARIMQPTPEQVAQISPGNAPHLQSQFEYVPSSSIHPNLQPHEESALPYFPSPREESLSPPEMGYGLGANISTSENFHGDRSGMLDQDSHPGGMDSEIYGNGECLQACPQCSEAQQPQRSPFEPFHQSTSSRGIGSADVGDYMSPPSSPGTDYDDDQKPFYELVAQSFPNFERPRSPSLLIDNDAFSSVPTLPTFRSHSASDDLSVDQPRLSRGILGRKGTAVLNKVLPRSLRLKRWSSTPSLPKLQILSPPPIPRMPSSTLLSPSQGIRSPGPPVPPNTAFDYDPYSDRQSDDDDDDETRRPTTRGTMMSREQLPTPPFLPTVAPSLPYIPQLDSPQSLSIPQSPSGSVHNLAFPSIQPPIFPPLPSSVRNNSLSSLSNLSFTSNTPISSPTYSSPLARPFDLHSSLLPPPPTSLNGPSLRGISTPLQSPQMAQRQFSSASEEVEDLLQQMELEDNAFEATENRMATSGWSTETELGELRAKRQAVRREWEERVQVAKKRRGSDAMSASTISQATVETPPTTTPVITLNASPNASSIALVSQP